MSDQKQSQSPQSDVSGATNQGAVKPEPKSATKPAAKPTTKSEAGNLTELLKELLPAALDDWKRRHLRVRFAGADAPEHYGAGIFCLNFRPKLDFNTVKARLGLSTPGSMQVIRRESAHWVEISPGGVCNLPTGIALSLPDGYEAHIRTSPENRIRGLACLNGQVVSSGDHAEVHVALRNDSSKTLTIKPEDIIAHFVIREIADVDFEGVEEQVLALHLPDEVLPKSAESRTGESR